MNKISSLLTYERIHPYRLCPYRLCPFGMVSIRDCVHSGWCPFGMVFFGIVHRIPNLDVFLLNQTQSTEKRKCFKLASKNLFLVHDNLFLLVFFCFAKLQSIKLIFIHFCSSCYFLNFD